MTTIIFRCGLLIVISSLLIACQHERRHPPPSFLVNGAQSQQLNSIIKSVRAELARYNYASLSEHKVASALARHNTQIHDILNQQQWTEYELHHREYWAYTIYTNMVQNYRSSRSGTSISSAWSSDGADRTDGTFGLNSSNQ